jgi:hypothetical protein
MHVLQKDVDALVALAGNIAEEIVRKGTAGALKEFRAELHRPRRLQNWLERQAVQRLLSPPPSPNPGGASSVDDAGGTGRHGEASRDDAPGDSPDDSIGRAGPLYTEAQFRLLFDPDERGWLNRSLLLVAVIERLHKLGWRPEDGVELAADVAAERDSDFVSESDSGDGGLPLSAEDAHYMEGTLT